MTQPVAVITGANRGIGRAVAVGFAGAGYAVDVAATCTFLSSDAAASITGADLNVNAGVAMY